MRMAEAGEGVAEVWARCFPLEVSDADLARFAVQLSAEERARAERFYFERDRRSFIAARGGLRTILGGVLQTPPAELEFAYGERGKPRLSGPRGERFFFNLGHSGEWALLAWTRAGEIGADIEKMRPVTEGLAERYFAPEEAAALRALPAGEQEAGFFRCWTRKEAYLKALGSGLALPLDSFVVSLAAGEPAALLAVRGVPDEAAKWRLEHLEPAPGYCAAIALRRREWRLHWNY